MSDPPSEFDNPQPPRQSDAPIKIDLYCLECGYNLRGLSGDPVRCPECGNFNPVALIEVPAEEIRRQLKKMESAPAASLAAMLVAALFLAVIANGLSQGRPMPRDWPIFAVAAAAILIWIRRVVEFRKSCNGKPGWIAALFRYQAIVIVLLFGVVLLFYGTSKLASLLFGGDCDPTIYLAVMPAPVALIVTVAVWWYRPMHRWMMRRVVRLQREVAVEIARQRVRHQMYRQHRRSDHP